MNTIEYPTTSGWHLREDFNPELIQSLINRFQTFVYRRDKRLATFLRHVKKQTQPLGGLKRFTSKSYKYP